MGTLGDEVEVWLRGRRWHGFGIEKVEGGGDGCCRGGWAGVGTW